jgi:CotH kinase protein/Lamin Tail Domain/Chitobiase/beta-hexosaminidase C-terminal domain/Secretion system C-terminal sorting domain
MRIGLFLLFLAGNSVSQAQIIINEVCAANGDIAYDGIFYNFSNWIEIHNTGTSPVDLSGYHLSDSPSAPTRWSFPSGTILNADGYLIVWCDKRSVGLHTNFAIEPRGDEIVLALPSGEIIDQVVYPNQYFNISYARHSGESNWNYSESPTPATTNIVGHATTLLADVEFGLPSGRYATGISLNMMHSQANSEIRYTTDGSEPNRQSTLFINSIAIAQTHVVKAKAFHADYLPSQTASVTYFINEHDFTLPVVSLSANPKYFFDNTIGVYVQGTNGIQKYCTTFPANWNQDWDRHGVFEYLKPTGERAYQQHLQFQLAGNCTRRRDQKSFALKAQQEFGSGKIQYPLFDSKPIQKYDEVFLRNAGNDNNVTHFRDGLLQTLPQGLMDIDYLAYQPTIVYINGQYWGIQNLREKGNGDYIENNYGISESEIDLIENHSSVQLGTKTAWVEFLDSLNGMSPLAPDAFQYIEKNIDVQEYINYLVLQTYYANTDWPNNIKFWRQRSPEGRFRWILWDADFGFGLFPDQSDATHPTLDYITATGSTGNNDDNFTEPIRLMLAVPEFKSRFIATLAISMGTVFKPSRVIDMIDQFKDQLQNEMPYHKQRWTGSVADWDAEVQKLRDFATTRHTFMQSYVSDFFNLDAVGLSVSSAPLNAGILQVNGVTTNGVEFTPYFMGLNYSLQANPKPGFQFSHWTIAARDGGVVNVAAAGDAWKYNDLGSLPAANWKNLDYNDASWSQGPSQLGYGDGDEQSIVGFGPSSSNKFTTTYFRRSFNIADTAIVFNLNGSVLYDDGVVVYVNGTEVFRGNMPAGAIANNTFAAANRSNENLFELFTIPKNLLRNGVNTISAEVHQFNLTSSDLSFDLRASMFEYGAPQVQTLYQTSVQDTAFSNIDAVAAFIPIPVIRSLVINEISSAPTGVTDESGEHEDWIELFNNGLTAVSLQGLFITDDPSRKAKFQLLAEGGNWVLAPESYQLLWADDDESDGNNHLSFKLSDEGEGIYLYQLVGYDTVLIASHIFGNQPHGFSLARIPNAVGDFEFTYLKTPGAANAQIPIISDLAINEFSATPTHYQDEAGQHEDWIELLNNSNEPIDLAGLFISDDPTDKLKHPFSETFQPWLLNPGSYQLLFADDESNAGSNHVSFKLSGSGEQISIYQLTGGDTVAIASVGFGQQLEGFSSARIPNGDGNFESTFAITPGNSNMRADAVTGLVLNELSAAPSSITDEHGDHDDWFELFNTGTQPIELSGLFVTDSDAEKLKYMLTSQAAWILPAGGYQLLWADEESEQGKSHVNFKLSSAGDAIGLYQVIGGDTVQIFLESFPFQSVGYSWSRLPNGSGPFHITANLTPEAANLANEMALTLYPNPAQNFLKLLLEEDDAVVSFYDLLGNIKDTFTFSTAQEASFDVTQWSSGVYYLRIQYPSRMLTTTVIIAR